MYFRISVCELVWLKEKRRQTTTCQPPESTAGASQPGDPAESTAGASQPGGLPTVRLKLGCFNCRIDQDFGQIGPKSSEGLEKAEVEAEAEAETTHQVTLEAEAFTTSICR